MNKLLGAVPGSMWWLFGAGYLGYTRGEELRQVAWAGTVPRAAEHDNLKPQSPGLTAFMVGGVGGCFLPE